MLHSEGDDAVTFWFGGVMVYKWPCLSTWAKTRGRAANVWACLPSHSVRHGRVAVQWHVAFILTVRPTVRSGDVSGLQSGRLGRDSGHTVPGTFLRNLSCLVAMSCNHLLIHIWEAFTCCSTVDSELFLAAWVSIAAPPDSSTMIVSNIYKPPFIKSRLEGRVVVAIKQVSPMKP